jgi:hypothetical protein
MGCKGIHCPGCGDGGGAGIGAVVILLVLAVIAAEAKAIVRFMAEVAHVLVLVAIAGVSIAGAAGAVIIALAIRQRLQRTEHATGRPRITLASRSYGELPEPRPELPAARADLLANVYVHPASNRNEVIR